MTEISQDLVWWVSVVDLPALSGLLWLIWRTKTETDVELKSLNHTLDLRCDQLREALHAFKLEVAKTYASQQDLRVIEARLVEHLLRIEAKLDATALKAEGLKSEIRNQS